MHTYLNFKLALQKWWPSTMAMWIAFFNSAIFSDLSVRAFSTWTPKQRPVFILHSFVIWTYMLSSTDEISGPPCSTTPPRKPQGMDSHSPGLTTSEMCPVLAREETLKPFKFECNNVWKPQLPNYPHAPRIWNSNIVAYNYHQNTTCGYIFHIQSIGVNNQLWYPSQLCA